jgi:hypothetical protein
MILWHMIEWEIILWCIRKWEYGTWSDETWKMIDRFVLCMIRFVALWIFYGPRSDTWSDE